MRCRLSFSLAAAFTVEPDDRIPDPPAAGDDPHLLHHLVHRLRGDPAPAEQLGDPRGRRRAVDSRHFNSGSYQAMVHELERRYNLNRPFMVQYATWIANFLRGDMGESFDYEGLEVVDLLKRTVPYSILISVLSLLFVYVMGIPIGIYSALHKYSVGDYVATLAGFIGLSIPNFFLALILMVFGLFVLGIPVGAVVLARVHRRAVEPGQVLGPALQHLDRDPGDRHRRHRRPDPRRARQPARRARRALHHRRARQGAARADGPRSSTRSGSPSTP